MLVSVVLDRIRDAVTTLPAVPQMDDARYMDAHLNFRSSSDQQQRMLKWLEAHAVGRFKGASTISVLSVGCGTGILDQHLVAQLRACAPEAHIRYVGCDPNPIEIERFKETFSPLCGPKLELQLHNVGLEQLQTTQRIDLIHIIHTLYYLPDLRAALQGALELLDPSGRLLIFNAPQGAIAKVTAAFSKRVWGHEQHFAEAVKAQLDALGVPHQIEPIIADLDLTPCFSPGDPSGELLVDFIAHGDTRQLAPSLRALLLDYLRSTTQGKNGRLIAPHPVDVFTVEKPV